MKSLISHPTSFAILIASATVLASCASPQPVPRDSSDGPVQPKVSKVVIAVPQFTTEGNDPGRDFTAPQAVQLRPMYDKLIGVDAKDNKLIPELATEWKLEPDGRSYRFSLRRGVQLHDNAGEFSARDVKMTFDDITQEGSLASNGPIFKALIDEIQAVSDHEVVTKLKSTDAEFLLNISQMVGGFEIVSKADYDKRGFPTLTTRPLAGAGPYQFKERQQGAFIRFERVPYQHYRITPDFPELEIRIIAEASTRMAALLTGELHLAPLPDDLLEQVERSSMKVARGNIPALRTALAFRGHYLNDIKDPSKGYKYPDSPIMNPKVRQALSKAVNREELNKAFFKGRAQNMVLDVYHPTRIGWNPDWDRRFQEMYGFDVDKARSLLAEAGYGPNNRLSIEMLMTRLTDVPASMDIQEAVATYWGRAGVDTKLVTMDPTEISLKQRQLEFRNHVAIVSTASHTLTGVRVYKTALHGLRGQAIELPEINDLYSKVSTILDDEKAAPLWKELGDKSFASFQNIPLFWLETQIAVHPTYVADYVFPGSISGSWTHLENIKAAR